MKLSQLDPCWLRYVAHEDGRIYHYQVDRLHNAQGVQFLCPKCYVANGGEVGTHVIVCWSRTRGTPEDASPGPGRWALHGTDFSNLTLDGDSGASRSVLLQSGCKWHGFITNGEVTDA